MTSRKVAAIYGGLVIAISVFYFLWKPARSAAALSLAVVAAAAIVTGVRRYRPRPPAPWFMIAAALVLDATGRLLYDALPGPAGHLKPWNWTVWVDQALTTILLVAGVLALVRSTLRGLSAAIDGAIIILGAGLVGGILIALPYARAATGVVGDVRVAYVARDVIILALIVHVATAVRWRWSVALMTSGLTGFIVYEAFYRLLRARGERASGTAIDVALLAFYALLGAAALTPTMTRFDSPISLRARVVSPARLGLVVVLALMPSVVLLLGLFRTPPSYQELIVVTSTLILILALARIIDVTWLLRRQVHGERVVRDAVVELAAARVVTSVAPALERAVVRLLPNRAPRAVIVAPSWAGACRKPPPQDGSVWCDRSTLTAEVGARLSGSGAPDAAPVLAIPVRDPGAEGSEADPARSGPVLIVGGSKSTLSALRPRLETLATQAGFALERIRVSDENVRHTSESYFRTLVQNSTDVILILDDDNRIRYASPSASELFGDAAAPGVPLLSLLTESDRLRAENTLAGACGQSSTVTTAAGPDAPPSDWTVRANGVKPARVEASCRDLRDDPSIGGMVVTLRNVTQQRLLEHELEQRALRDPLTGLSNRLPFSERLETVFDRGGEGVAAVLYADLDDLKMVNDAYGHESGDAMLFAVGQRLTRFVEMFGGAEANMAARLGGDEFVVLLTGLPDSAAADDAASDLLDLTAQPVHLDGHEVTCRLSIGVATSHDAHIGQDLLRNADLALYAAKGAGKGQWRHYEPWMRSTVMARLEVRSSLERAIEDGALRLDYQPIVALADESPVGFEALLRWEHPTRGRLAPKEFIDVAEESGLITPIGEWVLATAVANAKRWGDLTPGRRPYVSVNVSARQFRSPGFTATVDRTLDASGVPRNRVMLEITESLLLRDEDRVWRDLQRLRASGVRIAIDDFGTGYSALSYLRHVPLDVIKLDRSFTQSMATSNQQRELVQGIVGLADVLGLDVIAEGIETEHEREVALEIGCTYGQGYLFSRPLPGDRAGRWLTSPRRLAEPARAAPADQPG